MKLKKIINRSSLGLGMLTILASHGHGIELAPVPIAPPHPLVQKMVTKIQQTKNSESICVAKAFFRESGGKNCNAFDWKMLAKGACGHLAEFRNSDCGTKISSNGGDWDEKKVIAYLVEAIKNHKADPTALACSVDPNFLRGALKEVALQACGAAGAPVAGATPNQTWKSATPTGASGNNTQTWKSATPTGANGNNNSTNSQTVKLSPTELASGKLNTQNTKLGPQELAAGKLPHEVNVSPVIKRSLKDLEDRTKAQIIEIEKFQFALDKKKQELDQGLTGVGKVGVTPSQPLKQGAVLDKSTGQNSSSLSSYDIKASTENKNNLIDASKKVNESLTKLHLILKEAQTSLDSKALDQKAKEVDAELAKVKNIENEAERRLGVRTRS